MLPTSHLREELIRCTDAVDSQTQNFLQQSGFGEEIWACSHQSFHASLGNFQIAADIGLQSRVSGDKF